MSFPPVASHAIGYADPNGPAATQGFGAGEQDGQD
jgi:hypothetical protein